MMLRSVKITVVMTGLVAVVVDVEVGGGGGGGATTEPHPGISPASAGIERMSVSAVVIASFFIRNPFA